MLKKELQNLLSKVLIGSYTLTIIPSNIAYAEHIDSVSTENCSEASSLENPDILEPFPSNEHNTNHNLIEDSFESTINNDESVAESTDELVTTDDIIINEYSPIETTSDTIKETSINNLSTIEDNWLNREVSRQVFGDESRYIDLTNSNYETITEINLNSRGITGTIPKDIGKLKNLKTLNLYNNNLSGNIPDDFYSLSNLCWLSLAGNNLSGSLGKNIGNLTNLTHLYLDNNNLSGTLPNEIGNLINLEVLYLSLNKFNSNIPSSIGKLVKLRELYTADCGLIGSIPIEIGNLSSLETLNLSYNKLEGSIPNTFSNLSNLNSLSLQGNNLIGNIPIDFNMLTNLQTLSLRDNQIVGLPNSFPDKFRTDDVLRGNIIEGITNQKQLEFKTTEKINLSVGDKLNLGDLKPKVQLNWNGVKEELSSTYTLEQVVDSDFIDSSKTAIKVGTTTLNVKIATATDSNTFAATNNPITINIANNQIIEDNWLNREVSRQVFGDESRYTNLTDSDYELVTEIIISKSIYDKIPPEIGKLKNLKVFKVQHSGLTGEIPDELYTLTKLEDICVEGGYLTGNISNNIKNLKNLHSLCLDSNKLSGEIPSGLYTLTNLTAVYLGNNNFSGKISPNIGNLNKLTTFNIRNNYFTGELPSTISSITTLEKLDVSINNFTGNIFNGISKLNNLTTLKLNNNQFIGLGELFPDKFKTEDVLKGNFIEGIPNQKEIFIKNPTSISIEIGSKITLPRLTNSDVDVIWNGYSEELNSAYSLKTFLVDSSLFNSSLVATTIGTTKIKVIINQAQSSNVSAQSSNGFDVEVIKKHIPLTLTSKLSTKEWTNGDVVVSITANSSDDIDYIECSNGTKVSNNSIVDFVISQNGLYTFKAVNVIGETETIQVQISNIDKTSPAISLSQKASSNSTFTITATATDAGSGIKAIILPDGTYVPKNTATYIAPWDGSYEFTVIDNAGNTNKASISVSGVVLDELWLAKEVARQVKKDYKDLTQEDFDKITSINLSNKGITGKLPSYIGNLTNMHTLKLNGNDIRGSIPPEIGNLENLKILWLADNRLTGQIPSSIGNLVNLTSLDLGLNFLDGSIPSSLGQLKNLQYIFLCENKLTGTVPAELGNLSKLRELCIDFNQLIGRIPSNVKNLSAQKNFEYNFIEDSSSQNIMTIQDDTAINISLDEEINAEDMRFLISVSNYLGTSNGINTAYSLAFIPDDESFFKNGRAIKTGTTTGRVKISDSGETNNNAITQNSITINIQPSTIDNINPNIDYSVSTNNWTNESVIISLNATDNIGIKEIILPDGTKATNNSIEYTVDANGTYDFKAIDTSNNETVLSIPINNIDKELPYLKIDYDSTTLMESLVLNITGKDTLSGIKEIILPNGSATNMEATKYIVTENGQYTITVLDNAGNINSTTIEVNNIFKEDSQPDNTYPEDNIPPISKPENDEEFPVDKPTDIETPVIKDEPTEEIEIEVENILTPETNSDGVPLNSSGNSNNVITDSENLNHNADKIKTNDFVDNIDKDEDKTTYNSPSHNKALPIVALSTIIILTTYIGFINFKKRKK